MMEKHPRHGHSQALSTLRLIPQPLMRPILDTKLSSRHRQQPACIDSTKEQVLRLERGVRLPSNDARG